MSIPEGIVIALKVLYELFQDLHKSESDKFEKEWKEDEQAFLKAMQDKDSHTLAVLITKYSNPVL
jgi:hypothetical protein